MIDPAEYIEGVIANSSAKDLTGCTFFWKVPPELPYFEGHFPERPILPAVAIIDLVLEFIKKAQNNHQLQLLKVVQAKFMRPISPQDSLCVELSSSENQQWNATLRLEDQTVAKIKLFVAEIKAINVC